MSKKHARWILFVESFPYVIKYKVDKTNIVADALSHKYSLIATLDAKLFGFKLIKKVYVNDHDFGEVYVTCSKTAQRKFYLSDGYLYYVHRLCIPSSLILELLVKESHSRGLIGHFGVAKMFHILQEHFFWPHMKHDIEKIVE